METATLMEFKPKNLDRYPRLDTILMMEKELFRSRSSKTITEIWKNLKKKVMWTTFVTILDYLEYSGKIHVEADKTVSWLWNPQGAGELRKRGLMKIQNRTRKVER